MRRFDLLQCESVNLSKACEVAIGSRHCLTFAPIDHRFDNRNELHRSGIQVCLRSSWSLKILQQFIYRLLAKFSIVKRMAEDQALDKIK